MNNDIKGKIICLADGIDSSSNDEWVTVACSIKNNQKVSYNDMVNNLKLIYKELLTRFPQFRLKLSVINDLRYWVLLDIEDCPFEELIKTVGLPDDKIPEIPIDELPIWRLNITEVEDNKVRFLFSCSHSLIDGRSVFTILELFINIAENNKISEDFLKAENLPLTNSFKKKELFTKEICEEDIKIPDSWKKLQKCKLYPEVKQPYHFINIQHDFDYAPVSKFNRKYNFTCQALMMAIAERTLRKYHKGKIDDLPLAILCPANTRLSKYATENYKKGIFFNAAGHQLIFINRQNSLMEDIKHCKEELIKVSNTNESCVAFCYEEGFVDKVKKEIKIDEETPNFLDHNLVYANNIGKICVGREDITIRYIPNENECFIGSFCYNNGKTWSVISVYPDDIEKEFVNIMNESLIEVVNLIKNDK